MSASGRIGILVFALALGACGSESTAPASDGPGSGGSGSSAPSGGGGSAAAASGGSGGGAVADVLYASFVAESNAGESPAMVSFSNDTTFVMSLWVEQATFYAIEPGVRIGPYLASSDAVEEDTSTGKHENGACVLFDLKKYTGPQQLDPGKYYSMSVGSDGMPGFVGTMSEVSGNPFVALRAHVLEASTALFSPSYLDVDLGEGRDPKLTEWAVYDENRTNFQYAGPGSFTANIRFRAGNGQRYTGESTTLTGAPGYTLVVDEEPVSGAAAVVNLNRVTQE